MAKRNWKRQKAAFKAKVKRRIRQAVGALAAVLLVSAGVITIGENQDWATPSWRQIYAEFGIGETVGIPSDAQGAQTKIHFIDVGQADATLLEQNGAFALVDAGTQDTQQDLLDYLHEAGVEELDYVIMTHPQSDHIGGMRAVLDEFPVEQVLLPDFDKAPVEWWPATEQLMARIGEQQNPAIVMTAGDTYTLGDATITVLLDGVESDNVNNISPILLFEAPGVRFLMEGDAEKQVERAALENGTDLRATLFKAGHHGSATSNTEEFVQAVHPRIAVVSCGENNSYGHPHEDVLETFRREGVQVFRTDLNGTVVAYVDEENVLRIAVTKSEEAEAASLTAVA